MNANTTTQVRTARTGAEILEFIMAETMVAGTEIHFSTSQKVTAKRIRITGSTLAKRIVSMVPFEGKGGEWFEYTNARGEIAFGFIQDGTHHATYSYKG